MWGRGGLGGLEPGLRTVAPISEKAVRTSQAGPVTAEVPDVYCKSQRPRGAG